MVGLVQGIRGLVVTPELDGDIVKWIERSQATMDDIYWTRRCRDPFTWQGFLNWWVARRWILPYDIRRSYTGGSNRLR